MAGETTLQGDLKKTKTLLAPTNDEHGSKQGISSPAVSAVDGESPMCKLCFKPRNIEVGGVEPFSYTEKGGVLETVGTT